MGDPVQALNSFLESKGLNHTRFAELAGLQRAIVSHYCNGTRKPGRDSALAIEQATEGAVPARAWSTKKPRRKTAA